MKIFIGIALLLFVTSCTAPLTNRIEECVSDIETNHDNVETFHGLKISTAFKIEVRCPIVSADILSMCSTSEDGSFDKL